MRGSDAIGAIPKVASIRAQHRPGSRLSHPPSLTPEQQAVMDLLGRVEAMELVVRQLVATAAAAHGPPPEFIHGGYDGTDQMVVPFGSMRKLVQAPARDQAVVAFQPRPRVA